MLLQGGVLRYLHGCQAGPIQLPAPQPSFMPQISQMSQKTAVMDSVTVGDLSIFHIDIDIGYWQIHAPIYIYICIYQYFAPLSLSWLLFVPVSASGLFLPFPQPVMHLPSLLRTYRMKAKQWFQSKV